MTAASAGSALLGDGRRVAFQIAGAGPPLVLLAGQANSHHWWDDVRTDFTGHRTTITIDHPGTGDSDPPPPESSTRSFAADVSAVLVHLDCGPVDVYATSMGGRVAQWLAIDHGPQLRRLVLACTSPGGPRAVERTADVRRRLARPGTEERVRSLLELMYTSAWLASHPGPYRVLGDPTMSGPSRRVHLRASDGHDAWDRLPRIAAPTLILHGANDEMTPAVNAELLATRIPDSSVRLFPKMKHAFFDEARSVVSPIVSEFLDSHDGGAAKQRRPHWRRVDQGGAGQ